MHGNYFQQLVDHFFNDVYCDARVVVVSGYSDQSDGVERGRDFEFMTEAEFGTMANELFKGFILVCLSLLKNPT